jgi:RNA polymerase sigma-70 factor (ECF subfamily)
MRAHEPTSPGHSQRGHTSVVAAARRGDEDAFIAILQSHDRRLRRIASCLLRDRDLMDDALQEVAVKAARALPTLRDPDAIGAWLSRTTYRTCVDLLRRQRRLVLLAPDELPEPDAGGADFVDELAARDAVARLLATLTPEQRVAVVLVDQEGLDYRLAAEILDIPAGTIGSRLSKARAVLRRAVTASRLEERS